APGPEPSPGADAVVTPHLRRRRIAPVELTVDARVVPGRVPVPFSWDDMKTFLPKPAPEQRQGHVIDADGAVLARLAVQVADTLRGKNKPIYTPHLDAGHFVVVVNAEKVRLTGNKEQDKLYMSYSGWK